MTVQLHPGARWVLLGAGGHARSVADVVRRRGDVVIAVAGRQGEPRTGWSEEVEQLDGDDAGIARAVAAGALVSVAIGANPARWTAVTRTVGSVACPPLVARTATVAGDARLADGCQVLEHAHVGPASEIGPATIINTAAIVEHDCDVGGGAHLAPGSVVLGGASIGDRSFLGSGARVLPGVRVGADCVVGAGAVVLRDLPDGTRVAGVPARPLARPTSEEQH